LKESSKSWLALTKCFSIGFTAVILSGGLSSVSTNDAAADLIDDILN